MMCGSRVLKKRFWPKGEKVLDWRKLHSYRLHDLYPSLIIIPLIKSRRMVGGNVTCVGQNRST